MTNRFYRDDRITITRSSTWSGLQIDLTELAFDEPFPPFTLAEHEAVALRNALSDALSGQHERSSSSTGETNG